MKTDDYVGKAFRCKDGVTRWVQHQSVRGLLHVRHLEESSNVWHLGGRWKVGDFEQLACEEVDPPSGEVLECGPTGVITMRTVD